jgi:dipeptidyl aminopeptidase/acylaminoacyl peptidase
LNCEVAGDNPITMAVIGNGTIELFFEVSCVDITQIDVSVRTTGVDHDANGYQARAVGEGPLAQKAITVNGSVALGELPAGTYTVELLDLAPNCDITGDATRTVNTVPGDQQVSFAVVCAAMPSIAYSSGSLENLDIYTARGDGSGAVRLTTALGTDSDPAWLGSRIAFHSGRDGNGEIYVMNEDGSAQTRLTTNTAQDYAPAWSPDGTRIAFVSDRDGNPEIYVMNADGSNPVRITTHPAPDLDPAWSPDGTRIAFSRGGCGYYECTLDIHTVSPDGTNPVKLTESGRDGQPAWSPDGSRIAFSRVMTCAYYSYWCERNIAVMAANGTGVVVLPGDLPDESEPAWSPNGARILVSLMECAYYGGCASMGARVVRTDGNDPVSVVSGIAFNAVWRR